jgi:PTH1 family peptidyl-tRNA hydrolase
MKLIVGLGNPGIIYKHSRHNAGFLAVNNLAKKHRIALKKDKDTRSLSGMGKIEDVDVLLATPLTYMNLSGGSVKGLLKKYAASPEDLLVVCDDLDLEFGRLRARPSGSSGGQKGLKSIMDSIHDQNFSRLRIGIGRPDRKDHLAADYVLSPFTAKEKKQLKQIIEEACACLEVWVSKGITKSMEIFNRSKKSYE